MSNKILFSLLTLALFCQYNEAKSVATSTASSSEEHESQDQFEIYHLLDAKLVQQPRYHLFAWAKGEGAILCNFTTFEGRNIYKKVLKDIAPLNTPNAALQAHIATLNEFITEVDKLTPLKSADLAGIKQICDSSVKFNKILETFNTTKTDTSKPPTIEVLLIELALKKNGIERIQAQFVSDFLAFLQKFYTKVDEFIGSLTAAEARKQNVKLIEWYAAFKQEQDVNQQCKQFGYGFFGLPENELPK